MVDSLIAIISALSLTDAHQSQDTALVLQPPAAKCAVARNLWKPIAYCADFRGPAWLTRNPLPGYPPILIDASTEYTADLTVLVDSVGSVARFDYRDSVVPAQQTLRPFFRETLARS